jgi:hypothetical protein
MPLSIPCECRVWHPGWVRNAVCPVQAARISAARNKIGPHRNLDPVFDVFDLQILLIERVP